MDDYRMFDKQRKVKQSIMGIVFLTVLIGGWGYPFLGYFIPLCMLLGMGIGFSKGRKWCDWFCPRGSFFDIAAKPISSKKEIPKFFKGPPLRVDFLSFLIVMMIIQIIKRWPDPYSIGMFFVILLTITTILAIILSLIIHQRSWCCFCPIGSMANWVGRKKYPLRIDSNLCTECKLCYKVCPIQVAPYRFKSEGIKTVNDGDCLKCGLCIKICPKKALNLPGGI